MRFLPSVVAVVALACSDAFAPGDRLTGAWSNADKTLTAMSAGAVLNARCFTVQSGPLVLTDSLTFRTIGVVTQAGGLITLHEGDPYTLAGRLLGNRLVLGQDTLRLGTGGVHVCNA